MPFRHLPPPDAIPPAPRIKLPDGTDRAMRILVADDHADALQMLAVLLRSFGHDVATAKDGIGALEQAALQVPDVALLDLDMPVLNGFETARALRRHAGCAGAVLVAITGDSTTGVRAQTVEAGFDHHLAKPADLTQLLAILESAATRR